MRNSHIKRTMGYDPMTVDELRTLAEELERTATCALPSCRELVNFRPGVRGRRQRFCSGACRAKFSRERRRLHDHLARLEDTLYYTEPPVPTIEVEHLIDHVYWLLERYGGVDRYMLFPGISPRPYPSWEVALEDFDRGVEQQDAELAKLLAAEQPSDGEETARPQSPGPFVL